LLPRTTALENVELPLLYDKEVTATERRERAVHALEAVKLADRLDHTRQPVVRRAAAACSYCQGAGE